ncbi:hypothetical protein MMC10_002741 [Thelotrema lepadinum]|nr:hypothetical protein [Thelotrema lepadinum]
MSLPANIAIAMVFLSALLLIVLAIAGFNYYWSTVRIRANHQQEYRSRATSNSAAEKSGKIDNLSSENENGNGNSKHAEGSGSKNGGPRIGLGINAAGARGSSSGPKGIETPTPKPKPKSQSKSEPKPKQPERRTTSHDFRMPGSTSAVWGSPAEKEQESKGCAPTPTPAKEGRKKTNDFKMPGSLSAVWGSPDEEENVEW